MKHRPCFYSRLRALLVVVGAGSSAACWGLASLIVRVRAWCHVQYDSDIILSIVDISYKEWYHAVQMAREIVRLAAFCGKIR